ncbi:MAG TPA: metal-dependent transcriptional regulator [Anaerolineae bacterium]|nr:metal-dependent transcriptional regulator [Anaerolineae bacterium]
MEGNLNVRAAWGGRNVKMSGSASESVEMYLKTVAELGGESEPVPIGRVAERLGISPVSANEMIKRLGENDYIDHLPYKGVTLTENGRRVANSVIRRQRLWECFLVERLNMDWAKAYELACDLEHATAPEVTDALAAFLDHPATCPHGNLIPDHAGRVRDMSTISLAEVSAGESAYIRAVAPESSDVLAYLAERELLPGRRVTVVEVAPLEGPLTLQVTGSADGHGTAREVVLGMALAQLVLVESANAHLTQVTT